MYYKGDHETANDYFRKSFFWSIMVLIQEMFIYGWNCGVRFRVTGLSRSLSLPDLCHEKEVILTSTLRI